MRVWAVCMCICIRTYVYVCVYVYRLQIARNRHVTGAHTTHCRLVAIDTHLRRSWMCECVCVFQGTTHPLFSITSNSWFTLRHLFSSVSIDFSTQRMYPHAPLYRLTFSCLTLSPQLHLLLKNTPSATPLTPTFFLAQTASLRSAATPADVIVCVCACVWLQ